MPRSSQGGVGILFLRSSKPKACSAGDCYYYIKEVVPDSPAQRAGLDSFLGYFLVQVDGVSTEGLSMEQVGWHMHLSVFTIPPHSPARPNLHLCIYL